MSTTTPFDCTANSQNGLSVHISLENSGASAIFFSPFATSSSTEEEPKTPLSDISGIYHSLVGSVPPNGGESPSLEERIVTPPHISSLFLSPDSGTPVSGNTAALRALNIARAPVNRKLFDEAESATKQRIAGMSAANALNEGLAIYQREPTSQTLPYYLCLIEALAIANIALEKHADHVGLLILKAQCHLGLCEYTEALAAAALACGEEPLNRQALDVIKTCYEMQDTALDILEKELISESQSDLDAPFIAIIELLLAYEDPALAAVETKKFITFGENLIAADPNDSTGLCTVLLCHIIQQKGENFLGVFEKTSSTAIAETLRIMKQTLATAEKTLEKHPHHHTALILKTGYLILAGQYEDYEALAGHFDQPNAGSDSLDKLTTQVERLGLGTNHQNVQNTAEQLLEKDPNNLMAYALKIENLLYQGNTREALATINDAFVPHPSSDMLWVLFAKCTLSSNDERAVLAIDRALELNPKNPLAWLLKFQYLLHTAAPDLVVETAVQASAHLPGHPVIQKIIELYMPS